jgi:glutaredoxin-related protein
MSLSPETRSRIERTLAEHRVVLFMKGDRQGRVAASRPRRSASSTG